jgi:tRNA/rRNA methyltransferase
MAAGAAGVVDSASLHRTLEGAIADLEIIYAATARDRAMNKLVVSSERLSAEFQRYSGAKIGVVFGQENNGLTNEHIVLANKIITIPVNREYPSINLAQAICIICYERCKANLSLVKNNNSDYATQEEVLKFFEHLELELEQSGFFRSSTLKPQMTNNIRNIFKRIEHLTSQDISTLRGIIKSLAI